MIVVYILSADLSVPNCCFPRLHLAVIVNTFGQFLQVSCFLVFFRYGCLFLFYFFQTASTLCKLDSSDRPTCSMLQLVSSVLFILYAD